MNENEIKNQLLRELESLKDKAGFLQAGKPRFNYLFGRDSLIAAWQLLDFDHQITRATLKVLAKFQGKRKGWLSEEEPGKILHARKYFFSYYGSIDSTSLFLIVFSFYLQRTKDKKFLKDHWHNILSALNWLEEYGDKDKDGFLEYQRKNPWGLFHQGWKDSDKDHLKIEPPVALVEIQGYQYLALKKIAGLAQLVGKDNLAEKLTSKAQKLKEDFNRKFWMPAEKYFCLALNNKKNQKKSITSNPGHLLFTEIIDEEKINFVVKRLFEKDIWTPYGIRTHSVREPDFNPLSYHLGSVWPHDNWIIAQGFKKLGYQKEYLEIKKALLRAYNELGYLPEFYGVSVENELVTKELEEKPCHPQAWSSGALFNFLSTR